MRTGDLFALTDCLRLELVGVLHGTLEDDA